MGLWQNLCEAYTANEKSLQKDYPLSTTTINNSSSPLIVIVLDQDGNLRNVREIPKRGKDAPVQSFVIPVTEESMGRVGPVPHPLFDQYAYLKGNGAKFEMYLASLEKLQDVAPVFRSVYQYVMKRSIEKDVERFNPTDKEFILFEVEIPEYVNPKLWEDQDLMLQWHQYYSQQKEAHALLVQQKEEEQCALEFEIVKMDKKSAKKAKPKLQELKKEIRKLSEGTVYCDDMITGQHVARAISHPKKVVNTPGYSNAKLISDNDTTNFTFRGRFEDSIEAFAVGYDSSQRAHQFLRYIVNERGITCEGQVIVSFTTANVTNKKEMQLPLPPVSDTEFDWDNLDAESPSTQNSAAVLATQTGGNFAAALKRAITGYKTDSILSAHLHDPTMIIILDAATTGRLSVKFYREMTREDYLERLLAWHEQCQWELSYFKHDLYDEKGGRIKYVGAPSVDNINNLINGRSHGDKSYNIFKKQTREVLMRCIFDNAPFPQSYLVQAIRRASTPLANAMVKDKFSRDVFLQNIAITCALVNKSLIDNGKEKYKMSLDDSCCVRDYLYGRLLGAADKLEEYALYKKGSDRTETAAIRYMQTFSQKPFTTWKVIHEALTPYLQQVKNSIAANEIQETMVKLLPGEYENDLPLNGLYLLGYYCERAHIEEMVAQLKTNNEKEDNK